MIRRGGHAQVLGLERACFVVLLEAAVGEGAEEAGADVLPREAAEDLQLFLAVNQVVDLRAVDAEQELARTCQTGTIVFGEGTHLGRFRGGGGPDDLSAGGVGSGNFSGGATTYTAFVRAPLSRWTFISWPLCRGTRLHPFKRSV